MRNWLTLQIKSKVISTLSHPWRNLTYPCGVHLLLWRPLTCCSMLWGIVVPSTWSPFPHLRTPRHVRSVLPTIVSALRGHKNHVSPHWWCDTPPFMNYQDEKTIVNEKEHSDTSTEYQDDTLLEPPIDDSLHRGLKARQISMIAVRTSQSTTLCTTYSHSLVGP